MPILRTPLAVSSYSPLADPVYPDFSSAQESVDDWIKRAADKAVNISKRPNAGNPNRIWTNCKRARVFKPIDISETHPSEKRKDFDLQEGLSLEIWIVERVTIAILNPLVMSTATYPICCTHFLKTGSHLSNNTAMRSQPSPETGWRSRPSSASYGMITTITLAPRHQHLARSTTPSLIITDAYFKENEWPYGAATSLTTFTVRTASFAKDLCDGPQPSTTPLDNPMTVCVR